MHKRSVTVALTLMLLLAPLLRGEETSSPVQEMISQEAKDELSLAHRFLVDGRNEDAIRGFRKALEIQPGLKQAKFGIGTALIQSGKYREAAAIHEKLLEQYPDDFELLNNTAWMYATSKDAAFLNPRRAIQLARQAIVIAPKQYQVWSTLSAAYYSAHQFDRALQAAEEALRIGIANSAPQANVTRYEEQVGQCRKAAEAFALLE